MPKPVANGIHTPNASGFSEICIIKLSNIIENTWSSIYISFVFQNFRFFNSIGNDQIPPLIDTSLNALNSIGSKKRSMSTINYFTLNYPMVKIYI